MKPRYKELLQRAISAMIAAIEIHNKPKFEYRMETFTILAINAWELLLKAKWLKDNNNKISSLCVRIGSGKKKRIKKTRSGNPMTYEIIYLAKKLREKKELDEFVYRNLEAMVELRDNIIHFYQDNKLLEKRLFELGVANVRNFENVTREWFNISLEDESFYLLPLAFPVPTEIKALTKAERNFLSYIHAIDTNPNPENYPYAVTVDVSLRFTKSQTAEAVAVKITDEPEALPVRLTEEQIKERYPWDYKELTSRLRDRYTDFKVKKKYHNIRKSVENDQRYCYIRYLDPANPSSSIKKFYNPNILQVFDKFYTKKRKSDNENR